MRVGKALAPAVRTMPRTLRIICAAAMIVGVPGFVRAQVPGAAPEPQPAAPDPWSQHPAGAEFELGLAMPTGVAGVVLDWTPLSWFSLEAGFGVNRSLFGSQGTTIQSSLMSRWRLIYGGWGISLGVGASSGAYGICQSCPFESDDIWSWDHAVWLNTEGALEHRWGSGVGVRLFAGNGRMLNPDAGICHPHALVCGPMPPNSDDTIYLGIGLRIPLVRR